jgi:hypothetical protein
MEGYFVLIPLALTSLAVAALEWRRQARPGASLRAAARAAMETVGLTVLFFVGNVAAGALLTAAARTLDVGFISIYLSTDITLLFVSLLQALVFQRWREARATR